ncbi:MAG TPA: hypothetical protein VFO94_15025 [Gammaproteobacteria bacterium]|nr:hypothetical protein [Gammaproteobacteria bacterium]
MNAQSVARALLAVLVAAGPEIALAQLEEIVVTGSRVDSRPGVFLQRNADFLLLQVSVTNDTREQKAREEEIYKTLRDALAAAERQRDVEISVVTAEDLVYPLTPSNYRIELRNGGRPDTSTATISVKTAVPAKGADGPALTSKLRKFVADLPVTGRTLLQPVGEVEISVVGPHQYRGEIVKLVTGEARQVATDLGGDYRIVLEGIDRPVQWFRLGVLELGLFVPYKYTVIPQSVTAVTVAEE